MKGKTLSEFHDLDELLREQRRIQKALAAAVNRHYPKGCPVHARRGKGVWACVVASGAWAGSHPAYLTLRNIKTDKLHCFHVSDIVSVKREQERGSERAAA